jgi:hypothetical protein
MYDSNLYVVAASAVKLSADPDAGVMVASVPLAVDALAVV